MRSLYLFFFCESGVDKFGGVAILASHFLSFAESRLRAYDYDMEQ